MTDAKPANDGEPAGVFKTSINWPWSNEHATRAEATEALRREMRWPSIVLGASDFEVGADGTEYQYWPAYRDETARHADALGTYAPRVLRVERWLHPSYPPTEEG